MSEKPGNPLGHACVTQEDGGSISGDRRELRVASKDKGGKAEKKEPKKNLKEKRAAKKAKKK